MTRLTPASFRNRSPVRSLELASSRDVDVGHPLGAGARAEVERLRIPGEGTARLSRLVVDRAAAIDRRGPGIVGAVARRDVDVLPAESPSGPTRTQARGRPCGRSAGCRWRGWQLRSCRRVRSRAKPGRTCRPRSACSRRCRRGRVRPARGLASWRRKPARCERAISPQSRAVRWCRVASRWIPSPPACRVAPPSGVRRSVGAAPCGPDRTFQRICFSLSQVAQAGGDAGMMRPAPSGMT